MTKRGLLTLDRAFPLFLLACLARTPFFPRSPPPRVLSRSCRKKKPIPTKPPRAKKPKKKKHQPKSPKERSAPPTEKKVKKNRGERRLIRPQKTDGFCRKEGGVGALAPRGGLLRFLCIFPVFPVHSHCLTLFFWLIRIEAELARGM